MNNNDFTDFINIKTPLPIPDAALQAQTKEQRKEHVMALAQTCYDHQDMLWQDDWFELADTHLTPLLHYYIQSGDPAPKAMFFLPFMLDLSCNWGAYPMWRDTWAGDQDGYWEFMNHAFHFCFAYAKEMDFFNEICDRFPSMNTPTRNEIVDLLLEKDW